MNWMKSAVDSWLKQGMKLLPPSSDTDQMELSENFKEIYTLTGGMAVDEMDENMFRLWPMDEIARYRKYSDYITFADIGIGVTMFALSTTKGDSCVYSRLEGDKAWVKIEESAQMFFKRVYNLDSSLS